MHFLSAEFKGLFYLQRLFQKSKHTHTPKWVVGDVSLKNISCVTYFRGISALGTLSNIHSANWGKTTKYIY